MLRVFGQEIAELPLVATSNSNHGKVRFFKSVQLMIISFGFFSLVSGGNELFQFRNYYSISE